MIRRRPQWRGRISLAYHAAAARTPRGRKKNRTIADHGHGEVSCRVVKLRESSKRFY